MPSSRARPRGSPSPCAHGALALASALSACNAAVSPGQGAAETYEGPNFYESARAGQAAPFSSHAPGFREFVSEEPPVSNCVLRSDAEPPAPVDPTLFCPPIADPAISDFTFGPGVSPSGVSFTQASFPGGTFFYSQGEGALTSDVTGNDWHLSGTVDGISGFGLYFNGCRQLDASFYSGIAFTLSGELGAGGSLVFFVGTAENQVSHEWLNENRASPADPEEPPHLGRCIPVTSRYDGSCREPRVALAVPDVPTQVHVLWPQLTEGCPEYSVDPSQITAIAWYLPPSPAGAYSVDLHIDDLHFTDVGPR